MWEPLVQRFALLIPSGVWQCLEAHREQARAHLSGCFTLQADWPLRTTMQLVTFPYLVLLPILHPPLLYPRYMACIIFQALRGRQITILLEALVPLIVQPELQGYL